MSTTVLLPPTDDRTVEPEAPTPPRAFASARAVARSEHRSGVGTAGIVRAARLCVAPLSMGSRRLALGEHVLLRGSTSRHEELEGFLLRLYRRVELHHGRQDPRCRCG